MPQLVQGGADSRCIGELKEGRHTGRAKAPLPLLKLSTPKSLA